MDSAAEWGCPVIPTHSPKVMPAAVAVAVVAVGPAAVDLAAVDAAAAVAPLVWLLLAAADAAVAVAAPAVDADRAVPVGAAA